MTEVQSVFIGNKYAYSPFIRCSECDRCQVITSGAHRCVLKHITVDDPACPRVCSHYHAKVPDDDEDAPVRVLVSLVGTAEVMLTIPRSTLEDDTLLQSVAMKAIGSGDDVNWEMDDVEVLE